MKKLESNPSKPFDISELQFSEGKKVETAKGPRILKKAEATSSFWQAWRADKEALRAQALSCSQYNGTWQVCLWLPCEDEKEQAPKAPAITPISTPNWHTVTPYAHQVKGVEFLLTHPKTILADDMGLGKTMQALVAASCFGIPIHVICPKSLIQNWH